MHEMSIAESLIEIINEEMLKNSASRLISVRLNIGEMSGVVPEALETCFEVLTADTGMKGAVLKMEIIPLEGHCRKCDENFPIKDYNFTCPRCGTGEIDVVSGREMNIVDMEVE